MNLMRSFYWMICLFASSMVFAETAPPRGLDMLLGGMGGNSASDTFEVSPGRSNAPRILYEDLRGTAAVAKSDKETWSVFGRASLFDLSQAPVIPTLNLAVPTDLYTVQAGGAFSHEQSDRRGWGARVSVGSASDHLFDTIHETEFQGSVQYELPSGEHNAWFLLAQYSNNRTFLNNVPIPGFAYLWNRPDDHFRAIVGFPFIAIFYDPAPWSFRATFFGPAQQHLEVVRKLIGPLSAFAAYDHSPLSWLRMQRDNHANRLIYNQQKGLGGLRCALGRHGFFELAGGYSFQRQFYESKDATHADVPKANIPSAPFVSATAGIHF
jgi:hypothetical protein